VVGGAHPEPVKLPGPDHVGERHRGLDGHPVGQRRVWRRGVQVVVPLVVLDQLRQGARLPEQRVDQPGGGVLVHAPQPFQPGAQPADRVEFGLVVCAPPGPAPVLDEPVKGSGVRQQFLAAAAGVNEGGGRGQRHLGVMGKNQLDPFHHPG